MNERPRRPGRMVGLAEGVAAAVRRRQREREPRVVLLDASGASRVVAPSAPGYDDLLDTAERMLEVVKGDEVLGIRDEPRAGGRPAG